MGEHHHKDVLDDTNSNNTSPTQDNRETETASEEIENEELTQAEYQALDRQLDTLLAALDDIESKNDNIHAQLLELLDSNREIRQQLSEEGARAAANTGTNNAKDDD